MKTPYWSCLSPAYFHRLGDRPHICSNNAAQFFLVCFLVPNSTEAAHQGCSHTHRYLGPASQHWCRWLRCVTRKATDTRVTCRRRLQVAVVDGPDHADTRRLRAAGAAAAGHAGPGARQGPPRQPHVSSRADPCRLGRGERHERAGGVHLRRRGPALAAQQPPGRAPLALPRSPQPVAEL